MPARSILVPPALGCSPLGLPPSLFRRRRRASAMSTCQGPVLPLPASLLFDPALHIPGPPTSCPEFPVWAFGAQIRVSRSVVSPQICTYLVNFLDLSCDFSLPWITFWICPLFSLPCASAYARLSFCLASLPPVSPCGNPGSKAHLKYGVLSERFLSVSPTQTVSSSPLNITASFFRSSPQSALSCPCCILDGAKVSSEKGIRYFTILLLSLPAKPLQINI